MKLSTISILSCMSSALAFVPSSPTFRSFKQLSLYSERVDATQAIQDAIEASKKYGATSKEARLAWETVEEIDSRDNSAAYATSSDYSEKLDELNTILSQQKKQLETVKNLASELRAIKLSNPESSPSPSSPEMIKALDNAREITEKEGIDSSSAKLAWEVVENIASNDLSEAFKRPLDEECLIESIEACDALEELQEALFREKIRSQGRYQG